MNSIINSLNTAVALILTLTPTSLTPFPPRLSNESATQAMTSFVGLVHSATLFVRNSYRTIRHSENRDGVRTNKRVKLSAPSQLPAHAWATPEDIENLMSSYTEFRSLLETLRNVTRQYQQSPAMNEILSPIVEILSAVDGHDDYAITLYRECTSLLHFLDFTYDANKIARLREVNETVPCSAIGIVNAPHILLDGMAKALLAPEMPSIFKRVLQLGGHHNVKLPLTFINRIQMDLAAHIAEQPIPSYYLSSSPTLAALESLETSHSFDTFVMPGLPGALIVEEPEAPEAASATPQQPEGLVQIEASEASEEPDDAGNAHVEGQEQNQDTASVAAPPRRKKSVSWAPDVVEPRETNRRASRHGQPSRRTLTEEDVIDQLVEDANRRERVGLEYYRQYVKREPQRVSSASLIRERKAGKQRMSDDTRVGEGSCAADHFQMEALTQRLHDMPRLIQETNHHMYDHSRLIHKEEERIQSERSKITQQLRLGMLPSREAEKRIAILTKDKHALEANKNNLHGLQTSPRTYEAVGKDSHRRQERTYLNPGLRAPKTALVGDLPTRWITLAENTIRSDPTDTLTSTIGGIPLKVHDFKTLVPETAWLNDEIVNGTFSWLDDAINKAAGVQDVKIQTRKCLSLSSLFVAQLEKNMGAGERSLRRQGVTKDNILDVDTILLPICSRSHWTLLAILPSKKMITHIDPLVIGSKSERVELGKDLMRVVLKDQFVSEEWTHLVLNAPRQRNGYDCGVFTITNGICLALGLNPKVAYAAAEMRAQRLKIASVLLNKGFTETFQLSQY